MKISIESPHLDIFPELEDHINEKIGHLAKMYDRISDCQLVLKRQESASQKDFIAEARLSVPNGTLFAAEKAETPETAVNKLADDLRNQLQKYKGKLEETR